MHPFPIVSSLAKNEPYPYFFEPYEQLCMVMCAQTSQIDRKQKTISSQPEVYLQDQGIKFRDERGVLEILGHDLGQSAS